MIRTAALDLGNPRNNVYENVMDQPSTPLHLPLEGTCDQKSDIHMNIWRVCHHGGAAYTYTAVSITLCMDI